MGVRATVTSKGQVTIPKEIREAFTIREGDQLEFSSADGGLLVAVVRRKKLTDFRGALPANRPYPGWDAVREEVGYEIGRQLAAGGHE